MPQTLVPGGNAPLNVSDITIHINSGADIETLALRLAADGSPRDSGDFINSSQTQSADGSIRRGGNLHHSSYHIDLARQPAAVERILIACVASQPIARLGALQLGVEAERQTLITCPYDLTGRSETALVLGECYRRNGVWKFRNIAQGYNGGRQPLPQARAGRPTRRGLSSGATRLHVRPPAAHPSTCSTTSVSSVWNPRTPTSYWSRSATWNRSCSPWRRRGSWPSPRVASTRTCCGSGTAISFPGLGPSTAPIPTRT